MLAKRSLPERISRREFKRLLSMGFGNALRFLSRCYDPMQYADIIAGCITHDTCFDMQCEGDRGAYLCEAVMLTGKPEYFADIVMKRLDKSINDSWECLQMTNFLVCLYRDCGSLQDKIYGFFDDLYIKEISRRRRKNFKYDGFRDGFETLCISLFDIDRTYFERIVNDVGQIMYEHPKAHRFSLDWFFDHCTDGGKKRGRLKKADPGYARIFTEAFDINWTAVHEKSPTLDELLAGDRGEILQKSDIFRSVRLRRAAKTAGEDELRRAAEEAMAEKDEARKCFLLSVFTVRPFPTGLSAIMKMYGEGGEELREECLELMGQFPGDEAAAFALAEAVRQENPVDVRSAGLEAYVLTAMYVDFDILRQLSEELEACQEKQNKNVLLHDLNMDFRKRPDKCSRNYEALRRYFYNELRCTCCRERIVRMMVKSRDGCSDILDECLCDCSLDLRRYAAAVIKRRAGKCG